MQSQSQSLLLDSLKCGRPSPLRALLWTGLLKRGQLTFLLLVYVVVVD